VSLVEANPNRLESGKLALTVNPSGFQLVDEVSESDRREIYRVMHGGVLESSKYPDIAFEGRWVVSDNPSPDVYGVKVDGSLRLHGVTNPHVVEARVTFSPDRLRAHGEFIIFQSDYRIKSVGGSALKPRDELKFSFFMGGRRRQ